MKKYFLLQLLLIFNIIEMSSQEVEGLTLATFHFAFHNRDIHKTPKENQIDVLSPKYQDEIINIVEKLSKFKPTIIAIESDQKNQSKIDSLYKLYCADKYELGVNEIEQVGFRLARRMGVKKLYCTNAWGSVTENVDTIFNGDDSPERRKFFDYFYNHPDTSKVYTKKDVFKTKGILEELKEVNSDEHLRKNLGNYLIGMLKYQTENDEYFGVDFTTCWWFNRNLRIFRSIQKIETDSSDKIFVMFGTDHMNLLNIFFEASPEYKLIKSLKYLN